MPTPPIPPDSPRHQRLKALVQSRRDFARRELSGRHEKWRESERLYRTFVDPDELDAAGNRVHPFEAPIVLPLTYALTQTQLAFDLSAFTHRRPMIPLSGQSPEDMRAAQVMEQVLHHEDMTTRRLVDLYGWLLDRRRYGVGFFWNHYTTELGYRTRTQTVQEPAFMLFGIPFGSAKPKTVRTREEYVRFEGNEAWVADPYKVWWDPRVAIHRLQTGEFAGRTIRRAYSYMREQEAAGFYVNVSAIPKDPKLRQTARTEDQYGGGSDRDRIMGLTEEWTQAPFHGDTLDFLDHGYIDLDEGVFRIIPREYELSGSDRPEKWWVTLANDAVIVRAEPFDPDHQMYPLSAMEASPDPHSRFNPGSVEILAPLNRVATWYFNCYDAETEVLTERGWVGFPALTVEDRVATVDPHSREFWFETPVRLDQYPYAGEMVRLHSDQVDVCVTPSHRLWVARTPGQYEFVEAAWLRGGCSVWGAIPSLGLSGSDHWLNPQHVRHEPYDGMVYCFENSTHLTITRRHGRVGIHGQSHRENVVKHLNDWLLVNPGVVEMKDLMAPTPGGKLVRIKREFYTDPSAFDKAVRQLNIQDVTRSHMADLQAIVYMAQQVGAAPENLQGILSRNERTLGEQQMASQSASNRLKIELRLAWVQGILDWTHQRITNIQQYMTEERFVKVVGAWPRAFRAEGYPFLRVSPADVQGRFTYEVIDGTAGGGEEMTKIMSDLWSQAVGDPVLRQVYDTEHWFEQIAIRSGFSNIEDFLRQQGMAPAAYSTMPDEQVSREVEKGNLVPAGGPPLAGGNGLPRG